MLRLFTLLLFVALSGMLLGCGPIYKKEYAYVPPRSSAGKMCLAQCIQGKSNCQQMCQMRNENCRAQARQDAFYQYQEYKHERRREGKEVKKTVNDFDNSFFSCNESCDCTSSFNACYAACGGQVLERDVCVAFCNKK